MSTRPPYLIVALHSCLAGAVAGLAVNAVWFAVTGELPSLLTSLLVTEAVTAVWSIGQAARFYRKWMTVLASYDLPALGEGIDTPGRPPADDEDGVK
jgi:hypothetical protein